MTLPDILAIVAIALVVGGAVLYIVLAKKRGDKCVGCPYAKQCSGGCNQGKKKNKNK
jgi:hypothetical protein